MIIDTNHDGTNSTIRTNSTRVILGFYLVLLSCLFCITSSSTGQSLSLYREMDSLRQLSIALQAEGKTEEALTLLRRCDSLALRELHNIREHVTYDIKQVKEEVRSSTRDKSQLQKIITLLILLDLIGLVFFFYLEKQRAYKKLVIKNQEWAQHNSVIENILTENEDKARELNDKERDLFVKILDRFEKHKAYLDPELNITDFSKALESNRNAVSKLINTQFNKSFSALLNEYRIREAINILGKPENQRYTMQAISEMCGYHSRQVFYVAFKKETGVTPNEFVKMLRNKDFEE